MVVPFMSQTRASAGGATSLPTALMKPSRMTMVPLVQNFAGFDHDLAADQGMDAERQRAEAGREKVAGSRAARRKTNIASTTTTKKRME